MMMMMAIMRVMIGEFLHGGGVGCYSYNAKSLHTVAAGAVGEV